MPRVNAALADQAATEDTAFSFTVAGDAFSDVDGDALTYSATLANGDTLPGWLSFDTATRTFSGTPGNGDTGDVAVRVTATDPAGLNVSDDFTLNVAAVNDAPTLSHALADQAATLANGDPLPSWLSFDATTRIFSGTATRNDVGQIAVRVTATDAAGLSVSDDFDLGITHVPQITPPPGGWTRSPDGTNVWGSYQGTAYDLGLENYTLQGNGGNDSYLFYPGSGKDNLVDYDPTAGNIDTLRIGGNLTVDDIYLVKQGEDLYVGIVDNDTDYVAIFNQFKSDNLGFYRIEQLEMVATGLVYDVSQLNIGSSPAILSDLLNGNTGTPGSTTPESTGTSGDDAIEGGNGAEVFDASAGNDSMVGNAGDDTYVFESGTGDDVITDYDATSGNDDVIRLGVGITADDLTLRQDGQNLVIELASGDSLTVVNQYYNHGLYAVEKLEFSDGSQIDLGSLTPGSSAHSVSDLQTGDTQTGSTGADHVYGSNGADTYDTGAGDDEIQGNGGNDTYVFGTGYGDDRVVDYDASAGNHDVIRLGAGLDFSNVTLRSDGQNLYLELVGHDDSLTVVNQYYNHGIYQVEVLQFADGSTVDLAHLEVHNSATLVADLV